MGNTGDGINITFSHQNQIGSSTEGEGNLISGNGLNGISLEQGSSANFIAGNKIGTDIDGLTAMGNANVGLLVGGDCNIIGGSTAGAGNLVSGNGEAGVLIKGGSTNYVIGNTIGTTITGNAELPNAGDGVLVKGGHQNAIGGSVAGEGNLISGNGGHGVKLAPLVDDGQLVSRSNDNFVRGNLIGTNKAGTHALGNGASGVLISTGNDNTIGGIQLDARNIISGNTFAGIVIDGKDPDLVDTLGASRNLIVNNYIGTNKAGTAQVGNGKFGVYLGRAARDTQIGGLQPGLRNVISGNGHAADILAGEGDGIALVGGGIDQERVKGTHIQGNYIGTNKLGDMAIANKGNGVSTQGTHEGTILGGDVAEAGNVISGNTRYGVSAIGDIVVKKNRIGYKKKIMDEADKELPNAAGSLDPDASESSWSNDNLIK
jgi:titin